LTATAWRTGGCGRRQGQHEKNAQGILRVDFAGRAAGWGRRRSAAWVCMCGAAKGRCRYGAFDRVVQLAHFGRARGPSTTLRGGSKVWHGVAWPQERGGCRSSGGGPAQNAAGYHGIRWGASASPAPPPLLPSQPASWGAVLVHRICTGFLSLGHLCFCRQSAGSSSSGGASCSPRPVAWPTRVSAKCPTPRAFVVGRLAPALSDCNTHGPLWGALAPLRVACAQCTGRNGDAPSDHP
jgi:hypothetical protein